MLRHHKQQQRQQQQQQQRKNNATRRTDNNFAYATCTCYLLSEECQGLGQRGMMGMSGWLCRQIGHVNMCKFME